MKGHQFWLTTLTALWLLSSATVQAGFYRWVDAQGEVHYADVVPPVVSQQGHSELNERGMTIKTINAAPSAEQIAEQKHRETLAKLRDALANQQQQQDDYLLKNYADVQELEAVYRSKVALLEKSSQSLNERRTALVSRMQSIREQLPKVEDASQRKTLEGYLRNSEKTITNYDYALQENQTEQDRLQQGFAQDHDRLSRLLSASPLSPHPDPSVVPATPRVALAHQ
ncbi:MAG: hypothetical protein RI964_153 [Pseudomonadota bacterium]|jgi:hypothetical protein